MLQISINHVPDFIKLAHKSKTNILLVGNPGVGKSQVIESMRSDKCKVITMTGSSTIEEYVNGIPQVNQVDNVLEYIEQKWFKEMEEFAEANPDGMIILNLDEFNTAEQQVLKTFLTILAERRIPTLNKTLPEQVVIVAAMNPNDQNDTERLIRPMASRFMVLEVKSTIDTYKDYLTGTETESILNGNLRETAEEATNEQKFALLDQIAEDEWNTYNENDDRKAYHEINPRSFSAFCRALSYVNNKRKLCSPLADAFLGKKLNWIDDVEKVAERRAEKVNNGSVAATEDEMRAMTLEALEQYEEQLRKPNMVGPKFREARLIAKRIIREKQAEQESENTL